MACLRWGLLLLLVNALPPKQLHACSDQGLVPCQAVACTLPACSGSLSSRLRPRPRADVGGVLVGVRYMRDRKPVKVAAFAQLHNLFMALLSLWMTVETVTQVWILPATMPAALWELTFCMTPACSSKCVKARAHGPLNSRGTKRAQK